MVLPGIISLMGVETFFCSLSSVGDSHILSFSIRTKNGGYILGSDVIHYDSHVLVYDGMMGRRI